MPSGTRPNSAPRPASRGPERSRGRARAHQALAGSEAIILRPPARWPAARPIASRLLCVLPRRTLAETRRPFSAWRPCGRAAPRRHPPRMLDPSFDVAREFISQIPAICRADATVAPLLKRSKEGLAPRSETVSHLSSPLEARRPHTPVEGDWCAGRHPGTCTEPGHEHDHRARSVVTARNRRAR